MLKSPSVLDWVALIILFIGGLNWGLIGLFHLNLITALFGEFSPIARILYIIVGLCAIYVLFRSFSCCKKHTNIS
ncbi:DUF378 domain-containing protein [Rickettsiella massiliensis]|uniref:DUF378 domain-containing protein n=1 Tax=Rickettsiella massiliensis TaxID=676517 RepID=UPI00029AC2A3|nr:DUF378 domain-containing protein [Rickettsiella massiliensis]